jgi:twinkle protein
MVGVAGEDAWLSSPSSLAPPPLPPPPQQQGQYRQGSSSAAPYYDPRAGGRRGGAPGGSSGGYYQQQQSSSAFGRSNGRRPPSRGADPDDPYGTPPPPPIAPKRVSEMTAEERVAMLVDKLREQGDIDVPEAQQRPGAHRLECPACGNGSAQEDCFAVTIRDDCALWCCHRSTCGYSGAVSVYGGYAPSEAPAGGGGGGGGGGNGGWGEEDADAAAADHIRQWRAQRAREEAGGANGGGVTAGRAGPSPSATSFALPGTAGVVSSGGARGAAADASSSPSTSASPIPIARPLVPRPDLRPLTPELLSWFAARGISPATLERNGVSSQRRWSQQHREEVDCVAFPYVRDGSVVNVKYRALPKAFSQTKGGEKVFYGFDDIQPAGGEGAEAGAASAAGGADAAANADPSSSSSSTRQWLDEPGDVIIVEGEMDKLSLEEAGFRRVVSVPDGAVARVKEGPLPAASEETKFSYLHSAWPALRAATRVLLATDNDGPGAALADELARRIGREKCWRVEWPTDRGDSLAEVGSSSGGGGSVVGAGAAAAAAVAASSSSSSTALGDGQQQQEQHQEGQGGSSEQQHQQPQQQHPPPETCRSPFFRKDANDVLVHDGPSALAAYVRRAQPLPIRGLFRFQAFWQQVHDLYKQGPGGLAWGASTGWPCVDPYYRVVPGELTIVTGVPNSGKSEWLDALLVNLARLHGWSFALCSMENRPADHARKLMEKYCGRPFYPPGVLLSAATNGSGGNKTTSSSSSSTPQRMTASELMESLVWVDERFHLIRSGDEELPSVEWVLERARAAVLRYGVRGLVIDPYNELDHRRPSHTSETEYVSQMLTRVKRFAQHYDCHVWFVAHPRQLQNWRGGAPSMYDISGSAHFINKADNGIVVHRPHAGLTAAGGVQGGGGGFGGGGGNGGGFGGGEAAMAAAAGPGAGDPFAVQLLVRKVRNKAAGRIGDALLRYDRATGTYADYDAFVSSSTSSSERSS